MSGLFGDLIDESPTLAPISHATIDNATDYNYGSVTDPLSDGQEIVMSLLFVFSGVLSMLGSSTIVYKVAKNLSKATPYDRLMLGLSGCDIVASLSWVLSPFLIPGNQETSRVWARGTEATCNALGAISQFGFCAIVYNCILSFYFLLTVRFGVKRKDFSARFEPYVHIFPLLYFAATSIGGAVVGVYSEVDLGFGCWVNDFPKGCEADNSCTSPQIGWAFGAGPTVITFLALIVNNLVIFCYVKKAITVKTLDDAGLTSKEALSMTWSERTAEEERVRQQKRYIQEVASQCFLYVVTFLMAYTPAFTLRAIETYATYPIAEESLFPLFVLVSILLPMQGFFNMFVYTRPSYVRLRTAYPERSLFWTIRKACFSSDIPTLLEASKISRASRDNSWSRSIPRPSTSSARNFSSALQVVREVSQEVDFDSVMDEDSNRYKAEMDSTANTEDLTLKGIQGEADVVDIGSGGDMDGAITDASTMLRSMHSMKFEDVEAHYVKETAARFRSQPKVGEGDDKNCLTPASDYKEDASHRRGLADSMGSSARRISFDGTVSHQSSNVDSTASFWSDEGHTNRSGIGQ